MTLFFEIFLPIVFVLAGLALASFGNVIIYRENQGMSLLSPKRSICPICQHTLSWYDNIPLISYLWLRGKCRYCKGKISPRYPLVEAVGGLLFLSSYLLYAYVLEGEIGVFHYLSSPLGIVKSIAFSLVLLALFIGLFTDIYNRNIPLYLSLTIVFCSIGMYVAQAVVERSVLPYHLYALMIAFVFFVLSYLLGRLLLKKEVMGLGDVIVLVSLSLTVDFISYLAFVILITLSASLYEAIRMKRKGRREIPFIPYIFGGTLFLAYLSSLFSSWYFGALGL